MSAAHYNHRECRRNVRRRCSKLREEAQPMSLARDITTVGSGTLMSRLLAFARDAGIAALLGTGPFSEAFFAVLQVINFFRRLLAEGALNSAFVPIWLSVRAGEDGEANALSLIHISEPTRLGM